VEVFCLFKAEENDGALSFFFSLELNIIKIGKLIYLSYFVS